MTFPIPDAALARHIAVLGETGSGKTHDAKVLVEHLVCESYRVCVLDTIKSDWWGMISSASGKRAGLPFRIIGGPRGHVPLHAGAGKAIGELVGRGKLPLSIIDMADFDAGEPQQFFQDFAKALWRHMKGVLYLVIEEAHELAPKERAGFGNENMAVYWAKKLATGSRTKGIRLIIASQRTQAVHNALLGSCGTMIAHSLTLPADQKPVREWLHANILDKRLTSTIEDELAFLQTGSAWVCCAKERFFEKIDFPRIATFDNSATPDKDAEDFEVATAAVDHDELRAIIGEAVKEAEANDPKKLRAEIERLTKALAAKAQPAPVNTAAIEDAAHNGFTQGWTAGDRAGFDRGATHTLNNAKSVVTAALADLHSPEYTPQEAPKRFTPAKASGLQIPGFQHKPIPQIAPVAQRSEHRVANARTTGSTPAGRSDLPGPQHRILDSIATWADMGHATPSNAQVAWLAHYSPTSTSYTNPRGALKTAGLIDFPASGRLALTSRGEKVAVPIAITGTLLDYVASQLRGPEQRILRAVAHYYPSQVSNENAAAGAGYSPTSTSYTNPRGALKTKELITFPASGQLRAADWLFR